MAKADALLPAEATSHRVAAKGQSTAGIAAKFCSPGLVAPKKRKARKPVPEVIVRVFAVIAGAWRQGG